MKQNLRVSLAFAGYSDQELNGFAVVIIVCLKNNAALPDLPVKISDLTAVQVAFQSALNAAATGGPQETALKNETRDELILALRQTAAYVQSIASQTLSTLLSSGFDAVTPNRAQAPLSQPQVLSLENLASTQLLLRLQAVDNAKAYQVQLSTGAGAWVEGGIYSQARRIELANLTPGTVYNVRVRAIGGSTGYSDWSAAVSLMST